jgi:Helix-turn-helix domain
MIMTTKPLETLLAIKALCLKPGLTSNERRVGATLIEHYNRKTGRCDPGLERLATLLDIDKRTVMRAVSGLERHGLFRKIRHGGQFGRNFYVPLWPQLQTTYVLWDELLKRKRPVGAPDLPPGPRQDCHPATDRVVGQTCESNLQKRTYIGLPNEQFDGRKTHHNDKAFGSYVKRSREVAETEAERRWTSALHARFAPTVTYGQVLELITPQIQTAATEVEVQKRGAGITYVLNQLGLSSPWRGR